MNETIKLTASQLNEKIAELRGYKRCVYALQSKYDTVPRAWRYPDGRTLKHLPNFTEDIAAAMPLLDELPDWGLTSARVTWWEDGHDTYRSVDVAQSQSAAIVSAWYQWKKGVAVELMNG